MRPEQILFPMIRAIVARPRLAAAAFRFDPWGNPFSDDVYRDPYPMYDRMRGDGAVVYRRAYQSWFVTGHAEARELFASSSAGSAEQIELMRSVRPYNKLSEHAMSFIDRMIVFLDPPDHTRLRRLVSRAFTPRQVSRIEDSITVLAQKSVDRMLDDARESGGLVDAAAAFASPLPINVICQLLGVPEDRWGWVKHHSDMLSALGNPMVNFDPSAMSRSIEEMRAYFLDLAGQRRRDPRDDLVTELATVDDDGDVFSEDEFVAMVGILMFAGHETTTGLIGTAIVALADHPEQRRLVRDEPELWENAVEELLRWDTPVIGLGRTALEDLEVGGQRIERGQRLRIMPAAANRDPRRYEDPNVLRLDRDDPQPVSFGHGVHHCLGHALARMETRAALRAFVEGFGDYDVDTEATVWKRSTTTRGPVRLPVRPGR